MTVGMLVGEDVGCDVGTDGLLVGCPDGALEGCVDGWPEGMLVGNMKAVKSLILTAFSFKRGDAIAAIAVRKVSCTFEFTNVSAEIP
jgi:hypothetical protein